MTKSQRGIQSVEIGLRVAKVLAESPGALQLKELAARAGLSASKTHRYLVSLTRVGLVQQVDGRYDLGGMALGFGLAALARIDVVRSASPALASVRDRTGATTFLAVWGYNGPTIVRWEESSHPVTLNVRVGSTMPLLTSATGRLFAAFLPAEQTDAMLRGEVQSLRKRGAAASRRVLNDFRRLQAKIVFSEWIALWQHVASLDRHQSGRRHPIGERQCLERADLRCRRPHRRCHHQLGAARRF